MENIVKLLHTQKYSCVVDNFDEVFTFTQHGVADLYDMIKNKPGFLKKAFVADQIIGKAAVALLILGGVEKVYANVISLSALVMLREAEIEVDFMKVVPFIYNQDKTDWCPLEKLCYNESSVKEIFILIEDFINKYEKEFLISSEYHCKYPLY